MDKVAKEHNYVIHYKGQRNIQVNQMGKPQKATESNYIFQRLIRDLGTKVYHILKEKVLVKEEQL